jgi:NADH-quinone oxidoreductase subunit J
MGKLVLFLFQSIALFSMIFLTNLRNPVHSVFLLILVFANVGAVLLFLHVEFLALVYVIVYLGAIAVLFLFAVMMLNIKLSPITTTKNYYAPIGAILTLILGTELAYVLFSSFTEIGFLEPFYNIFSNFLFTNQLAQLAIVLFLFLTIPFLIVSLVLLVALIGAIVLTLSEETDVRRQVIAEQLKASVFSIRNLNSRA